jgi:hypothetical protein
VEWKKLRTYEWLARDHRCAGADDLCAMVKGLCGKHIRVTVEEEVKECCEKWWGKDVCSRECLGLGRYVIGARCIPTHCPECGKRL